MPKFSEQEKEIIRQKLKAEGERLFASFGLKKVTIDDLVGAVEIAKASFYTFYPGKEYLYMDIVQDIQQKIFSELEVLLESNANLPGKERVKQVFGAMYQYMMNFPILARIDSQTVDFLKRKVSAERMAAYQKSNFDAVQVLHDYGVQFVYDVKTVSLAFQALYGSWISLQREEVDVQKKIIDILLNGIIDRTVADWELAANKSGLWQ